MHILITGAASPLGQALTAQLRDKHQLRLIDAAPFTAPEKTEALHGSLCDPDLAWRAVRAVDAVLHTGEPPAELPADELARDQLLLDLATRGTHVLCKAAVEAGVKRLVYGSTLEVFRAYPDDRYISEMWRPLPPPDMPVMSRYLGELTCREFARDYLVSITALRLGKLVLEEEMVGQPPDLMWLDQRDAVHAFACALQRDTSQQVWWNRRWTLCHISAPISHPKYLISHAGHVLGYQPQHNFATHWPAAAKGV